MNRTTIILAIVLAVVLMALRVLEFQYMNKSIRSEIYIGILVSLAVGIGIWMGKEFLRKKGETHLVVQKEEINRDSLLNYGLSKREVEILELIDKGFTNQQIADHLFVSLNTIKTHTTNIYNKLDVKNRVQAISKAKALPETS